MPATISAQTTLLLPVETIDLIFQDSPISALPYISRVNRQFHGIAVRILYRTISLSNSSHSEIEKCIRCLRSLKQSSSLASLCHTFELRWPSLVLWPTLNFYRAVSQALRNLTSITSLSLEVAQIHSPPSWFLVDCTFALQTFTTTIPCSPTLAEFLETQSTITELDLLGHGNDLPLTPSALPRLTELRTVHSDPMMTSSLLRDRPVLCVSLQLMEETTAEILPLLHTTSTPIERLSLISFDSQGPAHLFALLAKVVPHLHALHIVFISAPCTVVRHRSFGSALTISDTSNEGTITCFHTPAFLVYLLTGMCLPCS